MPISTQRVLDYLNIEWPAYAPTIQDAVPEKRDEFLKAQGYIRLADLIAHIVGWWEEAHTILSVVAQGGEVERKKYDFDQFNAASVARFQDRSEQETLAYFEEVRQKLLALLVAHPNLAETNKLARIWLYNVVIHHAAEHAFAASRFLTLDWLNNDWAEYLEDFASLPEERKQKFLAKQGFTRFRDVVAHIIAWFDESYTAANGYAIDPNYQHPNLDVDAYNAEVVARFGALKEEDVWAAFETSRQRLVGLVNNLSDEALRNPDVQSWIVTDVIGHYFDH